MGSEGCGRCDGNLKGVVLDVSVKVDMLDKLTYRRLRKRDERVLHGVSTRTLKSPTSANYLEEWQQLREGSQISRQRQSVLGSSQTK